MGFCEKQARKALAECVWDVNRAIDLLVSRGEIAMAPTLPKSVVRDNDCSESILTSKSRDFDNSTTASTVSTPRFQAAMNLPVESGSSADTLGESKDVSHKAIRRVCRNVISQDAMQLAAAVGDFVRVA